MSRRPERVTDSVAAGIQHMTIESQVRRPND